MTFQPIVLPDDPRAALQEIASYLRSARTDRERRHFGEGFGCFDGAAVGYWQTEDWFTGLAEIAAEAERVATERKADQ
jgi:hypothetical protein